MKKVLSAVVVLLALAFGAVSLHQGTPKLPLERVMAVATTIPATTTTTTQPPPPLPPPPAPEVVAPPKKTTPIAAPAQKKKNCHPGWTAWDYIRAYESGGRTDPAGTNEAGGGYYQFLDSTWRSVGGSGRAQDASYEEQTMRAQMLQQRSGWGQWSTAYHAKACGAI